MTPAQLIALGRPCFSPDDWCGGWYRRVFPVRHPLLKGVCLVPGGDLIASVILTLDVALENPQFLPPGIGPVPAAWHVSFGFVLGSLRQAKRWQALPLPPPQWSSELHHLARLYSLEALEGVGQSSRDHYWVSHVSAHLWRAPVGHELDGVADAAAERIGRVLGAG